MPTKPVHPFAYGFPADDYASLGEEILHIRRAQREPMIDPNGVGDDFARETIALQAWHLCWYFHAHQLDRFCGGSKLAIPHHYIRVLKRQVFDSVHWHSPTMKEACT
ncbi:hypothetical protein ATO3_25900 [Marinibacterium profundimaris]|uniref:Uncharacterized protein n=1 Tax=Marinibacterium profundimaris TaxID=1679460 RepID=A0A225NB98_9RHOB|nr:hypothetical protein ATO3_25900 [Marinibacterium profundimaris]